MKTANKTNQKEIAGLGYNQQESVGKKKKIFPSGLQNLERYMMKYFIAAPPHTPHLLTTTHGIIFRIMRIYLAAIPIAALTLLATLELRKTLNL